MADTNVVVSASLWTGTPGVVFSLARRGDIALFASRTLLEEFREVIQRRKFARQVQRTGRTAMEIYRDYRILAERVPARRLTLRIARDADDDQVLACVLAARAQLVVSGDDDLLALGAFRGIEIIAPAVLAKRFAHRMRPL